MKILLDPKVINQIYRQRKLEENNPDIYLLISTNESHSCDLQKSFYTDLNFGVVYLLYESSESGRDGTVIEGYNLYIQERDEYGYLTHSEVKSLGYDDETLNILSQVIINYLSREDNTVDRFLQNIKKNFS